MTRKNKEETKKYNREYYLKNKEGKYKEYREKNKEKIKNYTKKYREDNLDYFRNMHKEYYQENKEKLKHYRHEKQMEILYGINKNQYNELLERQLNCCAICGKNKDEFRYALSVDHNHETGKIRGLLCLNCNTGIGKFEDKIELVEKALNYLKSEDG
jgi:Autographiviridae endonuclease VII